MKPRRTPPGETSPDVAQELADELRAILLARMAVDPETDVRVVRTSLGERYVAVVVGRTRWEVVLHDTRSVVRTEIGAGDMTAAALAGIIRRVLR